jgi:hypothetical protein
LQFGHNVEFDYARVDVSRRPTTGWVIELFLRERTKTSRNVTISFSLTFKARPSPERATATRGRVPLVINNYNIFYFYMTATGANKILAETTKRKVK